jgi:hypothetical protein
VDKISQWSHKSGRYTDKDLPVDYIAFYPAQMDVCYVDAEKVEVQEGDFYGGWITKDIVGPFKEGQGTFGW